MSKATIVSIYPRKIQRNSIGIIPPVVMIDACTDENSPVFAHFEDVHHYQYILDGKSAKIPILAFEYAKSIAKDFHRASFGSNVTKGIYPGVAAVEGHISNLVQLNKEHPDLHKLLKACQMRWKEALVKKADSDWSRVQNPALITEIQIEIARDLKLNKPWAKEFSSEIFVDCPACYGPVNSRATICRHCKSPLKAA